MPTKRNNHRSPAKITAQPRLHQSGNEIQAYGRISTANLESCADPLLNSSRLPPLQFSVSP